MESPLQNNPTTTRATATSITTEIQTLETLSLKGSWRTILDKTTTHLSLNHNHNHPHIHLTLFTYHIISLSKLRRYSDALSILESQFPDLDSPSHRYDFYPHIYAVSTTGSMIPFALRLLHSVLPSFVGRKPDSIDRLYLLLSFVRSHASRTPTSQELWRRREVMVVSTIISCHCSQKDYLVCVDLLNELIVKDPNNVGLLSKLGYVQLQFGDIEGAKSTFSRVEKVVSESEVEGGKNLVGRNKALVYLVGKDYVSAVREYDECIERDESDVVSINNKALCLMYLRDLADSIKVLETSLEKVPTVALNETLVVNLCSMYELAYVNHTDVKKTLSNWIARLAPDDFDSSCTRV